MPTYVEHKWTILIVLAVIAALTSASVWLSPAPVPRASQLGGVAELAQEPIVETTLFPYIEVMDGCGPEFDGACVNVRSGPDVEYPVVAKLRRGMVLKISDTAVGSGREWYKISFDEGLRYPERVSSDWYVAADIVQLFTDDGEHVLKEGSDPVSAKRIIVDRSEQMLYAYDGDMLFMQEPISTGLELTPTPRGNFRVFKMTPSRYMQGPLPGISDQYYDLPGVPWNLYFTEQGAVIHGAYWHNNFGEQWSHGCVNLPPQKAKQLYHWAEIGTHVLVRD